MDTREKMNGHSWVLIVYSLIPFISYLIVEYIWVVDHYYTEKKPVFVFMLCFCWTLISIFYLSLMYFNFISAYVKLESKEHLNLSILFLLASIFFLLEYSGGYPFKFNIGFLSYAQYWLMCFLVSFSSSMIIFYIVNVLGTTLSGRE
ncbi:hypothetical protein SAMN05444141_109349 [Pseudovibrio denitrificans]|uniref:Uncharacterized protein n=1 Tax=Pseudovibrio denitrificans TaxID=258256 RepID=A0A1I7DQK0_9HYPH|nr:hypothetical protein SAMN05444141_109349 [Pseudovibrio denitrificans]